MGFRKKVVLVTGATSFIGEATATLFAKENANLVLTDRDANKLRHVANKCETESIVPIKPLCIAADLTNETDIKKVLDGIIKYYGKLDVLVNNAGEIEPLATLKSEMNIFDETFNLNVRSVYHLTMLLAPILIENKGTVINVPSVHTSSSYFICYSMAKSALDKFTDLAALKLGPKGVRVNSVNPGNVQVQVNKQVAKRTRHSSMMHLNMFKDEKMSELSRASHLAATTSCEVEEIASAVVYLASDQTRNMTGTKLMIDGGLAFSV